MVIQWNLQSKRLHQFWTQLMKPPAKIQLPEFKVIYYEQEKLASGTLIRAKLCLKHHLWDGSSLQNM